MSNVLASFYKKRKKYNCKHYTNLVGIQIEITSDPYFGRMGKLYIKNNYFVKSLFKRLTLT